MKLKLNEPLAPESLTRTLGAPRETALSVVVPAYNEERRLAATVEDIFRYAEDEGLSLEVIVVSDGSTDGTCRVVRRLKRRFPGLRLISYRPNRGKGYAVRAGVWSALGEKVLLADADGSTPIEELRRLWKAIEGGADVAIGSRAAPSRETVVQAKLSRKIMGRVFNWIVNLLLVPGIYDSQCGFKLFSKSAARRLFGRQKLDGFSFDVEILALALRGGLRVAEIPVNWTHVPESKVRPGIDSGKMLLDVLRLRWRFWKEADLFALLERRELAPTLKSGGLRW